MASSTVASIFEQGSYPVILFLHGFAMHNYCYRQLLEHIVSHGYIAVAPQLSFSPLPSSTADIESAAKSTKSSVSLSSCNEYLESAAAVANWLPGGLQPVLPGGVRANLRKVVLAGHSKGGHTAFSLAMKTYAETTLDFSVLLGIDPVAGFELPFGKKVPIWPRILTHVPNSFDIDVPVLVVGSGLGEQSAGPLLPCAPQGLNHAEFFYECKPPCSYFVVKDYGHLDLLDDDTSALVLAACKCGKRCNMGLMRRSIAGLAVAFLKAYLDDNNEDLQAVVADPGVAPARLDPVAEKRPVVAMSR